MRLATIAIIGTAGLVAAALSIAGPLDPPAGPVGSTFKTLAEVEPRIAINAVNTPGDADSVFRITQPGSYYLTGNVQVPMHKWGIEIAASRVTIDLNGFTIEAVETDTAGGILSSTPQTGTTIRNGFVYGGEGHGVQLSTAAQSTIENLTVQGWTGNGIAVGNNSSVTDSSVRYIGEDGFVLGVGCAVRGSRAADGAGYGFFVSSGCVVEGCNSTNNHQGFRVYSSAILRNCVSSNNADFGILAFDEASLFQCTAKNNRVGICVGVGGLAEDCVATANAEGGFEARSRSVLRRCVASGNTEYGIRATATQNGVRIESNHVSGSARGIYVLSTNSTIIGNTCVGNITANYTIAIGNHVGTIVTGNANAATITIGTTGTAGGLGTTDPFANFAY